MQSNFLFDMLMYVLKYRKRFYSMSKLYIIRWIHLLFNMLLPYTCKLPVFQASARLPIQHKTKHTTQHYIFKILSMNRNKTHTAFVFFISELYILIVLSTEYDVHFDTYILLSMLPCRFWKALYAKIVARSRRNGVSLIVKNTRHLSVDW